MKKPKLQSVEEIHKEIAPLVDKMRAKYPQDLEGLEPALTSDIAEIVYQDRTTLKDILLAALEVAKADEHPMEGGVPVETYGYEVEFNSAIDEAKVIVSKLCV